MFRNKLPIIIGFIFFIFSMPLEAKDPVLKTNLSEHKKRIAYFIKKAECKFKEIIITKDISSFILWQKSFYCKESRVFLNAYIFDNQKNAILFAEGFVKDITKIKKKYSKYSSCEYIKYAVNGSLLYVLIGDDKWITSNLVSYFSGEE